MVGPLTGYVLPPTGIRGHSIVRQHTRSSLFDTEIHEEGGHHPFDW